MSKRKLQIINNVQYIEPLKTSFMAIPSVYETPRNNVDLVILNKSCV